MNVCPSFFFSLPKLAFYPACGAEVGSGILSHVTTRRGHAIVKSDSADVSVLNSPNLNLDVGTKPDNLCCLDLLLRGEKKHAAVRSYVYITPKLRKVYI